MVKWSIPGQTCWWLYSFEFDVTGIVQFGKNNTIAVSANNEYQRGAWWHWGVISREVKLERNNHQQIISQQITSEPDFENGSANIKMVLQENALEFIPKLFTNPLYL